MKLQSMSSPQTRPASAPGSLAKWAISRPDISRASYKSLARIIDQLLGELILTTQALHRYRKLQAYSRIFGKLRCRNRVVLVEYLGTFGGVSLASEFEIAAPCGDD